jgi:hypothetical protein
MLMSCKDCAHSWHTLFEFKQHLEMLVRGFQAQRLGGEPPLQKLLDQV